MFLDKLVNFKDFSRSNKEIKYSSRTLTEFKDFSRQLLRFKIFSRLYEPWNAYWRCVSVKKRGGWGGGEAVSGNLAKNGWWQFPDGKYAFKFERFVYKANSGALGQG